jgi:4-diphosphocytidyl-2-C-methyl-D-erythritol kinase
MLTVKAPAKINLTLEVLGKRPDGYHEIKSVLQTVDLCDTLRMEVGKSVIIRCDIPEWSEEKSLLSWMINLLKNATGCSKGVTIEIEKRLPLMAGLGGDSSDAAALLRSLDKLWKLGLSSEKMQELAAQVGSDVVFFLRGGTALVEGRGEIITPLPALPEMWVVLVVPDIPGEPGKTGRMYASLKPQHFTDGRITEKLVITLHKASGFTPALLYNAFENTAFTSFSGLNVYKEHLIKLGVKHVHLAGSGPALFTMFQDKSHAQDLFTRCKSQRMKAYLASTVF